MKSKVAENQKSTLKMKLKNLKSKKVREQIGFFRQDFQNVKDTEKSDGRTLLPKTVALKRKSG